MPQTIKEEQSGVSPVARKIEARLDQLVKRNWASRNEITARGAAEIIDEELVSLKALIGGAIDNIEKAQGVAKEEGERQPMGAAEALSYGLDRIHGVDHETALARARGENGDERREAHVKEAKSCQEM